MISKIFYKLIGYPVLFFFWIINSFGSVVALIWLIIERQFKILIGGLIIDILATFLLGFAYAIPAFLTAYLIGITEKIKNEKKAFSLLALPLILDYLILGFWVNWILGKMFIPAEINSIPILLWWYIVIVGPLMYMASKEPSDHIGNLFALTYVELLYWLLIVNKFYFYVGKSIAMTILFTVIFIIVQLLLTWRIFKNDRIAVAPQRPTQEIEIQ